MMDLNKYDADAQCSWVSCGAHYCAAGETHRYTQKGQEGDAQIHWEGNADGSHGPCTVAECFQHLHMRTQKANMMLYQRVKSAKEYNRQMGFKARTLIVASHFPTDFLDNCGSYIHKADGGENKMEYFNDLIATPEVNIVYYGAHRHSTENKTVHPTGRNPNYVVGGGGGWSCDEGQLGIENQGVVVAEIYPDGTIRNDFLTVPREKCCIFNPARIGKSNKVHLTGVNPFEDIGGRRLGDVEQRKAIADVLHLDDRAQDRMLAVGPAAYLRERALCAEDPNFCTSDDIPLNASVIALRRWENAQEERRERRRRR